MVLWPGSVSLRFENGVGATGRVCLDPGHIPQKIELKKILKMRRHAEVLKD